MATATTLQPSAAHQHEFYEPTLDSSEKKSAVPIPSGPTSGTLVFYEPPADGSRPWNYVEVPTDGSPQRNYGAASHKIEIDDIRGRESEYDLNKHAFAVVHGVDSAEKEFTDDDHIKATYYPEVEQVLLKNVPGANRVLFFDHTVRRSGPGSHRGPVTRVHIDQTAKASAERVRYHLPDEADELLKGRYRLINVWRPLNGPVLASPLAFAASDSVPDHAVVPVEHRYPYRTGETAGIQFTEGQKWHYLSGMTNDERLLLQCFDSQDGARVPHTAFEDPHTPEGAPGRDSIEVRALVFG